MRHLIAALTVLTATSCIHTEMQSGTPHKRVEIERIEVPALGRAAFESEKDQIKAPQHPLEARAMLREAFEANEENDIGRALPLFEAVLESDFLSDAGLANLYWTVADGHFRLGHIDEHFNALGNFLVAESLVERAEADPRVLVARSVLNARKVATQPGYGRSKDRAIELVDPREMPSIVQALPCGPNGAGRFVSVDVQSVHDVERSQDLVQQRSRCTKSTTTIELWFDVTHTKTSAFD